MKYWIWLLVLSAGVSAASGATVRTRDGKTYVGQVALSDGRFAITTSAGQTVSIAASVVAAMDFRAAAATVGPTTAPDTQPQSPGSGLRGEYFADNGFRDLKFVRGDPDIYFNFAPPFEPINSPADPMAWQSLAVRWTGRIRPPTSEKYTFYAPDGSLTRLWIDHRLIIDVGQQMGAANLEAGKEYDFRVDWVGHHYLMSIQLEWSSASVPRQVIAGQFLYPPADDRPVPPTAQVTAPVEGTLLAGPVDVPMSVAIRPGTSTPVQVVYRDDSALIGVAKAAPFDRVWPKAPLGDHHIIATVTDADGTVGTSEIRHLIIASAAGQTLPKPWLTCDVPSPSKAPFAPPPPLPRRHPPARVPVPAPSGSGY